MRVCTDGYIDLRDPRRVRTPGYFEDATEPLPVGEALAFLLSHSFPGHRKVVRAPGRRECVLLRKASWAASVNERMGLVDQAWRALTRPVAHPPLQGEAKILQVVVWEGWAYPLILEGEFTRVIPAGGLPLAEAVIPGETPILELDSPVPPPS